MDDYDYGGNGRTPIRESPPISRASGRERDSDYRSGQDAYRGERRRSPGETLHYPFPTCHALGTR